MSAFEKNFTGLYTREGLISLDRAFCDSLATADETLASRLTAARANPDALEGKAESELLVALGPHVEDFIAERFGIGAEVRALSARHHALAPLYSCRRRFVQRKAIRQLKAEEAARVDAAGDEALLAHRFGEPFTELAFARHVNEWMEDEAANAEALAVAIRYAAWATLTDAGRARHPQSALFKTPAPLDPMNLIPHLATDRERGFAVHTFDVNRLRRREGFALTDKGTDLTGALGEIHYCIWCHEQGKDSCSHGLRESAKGAVQPPPFKKSAFGVTLAGCPLEERISEFHKLKAEACAVGALAMIVVDNPMVAATGHRICNDCMKACIYQKQEPVNIPQVETRALKDVLDLPWGFEIYSLLTRWNPLNLRRPYPHAPTGKRVLVAGMGPAGFTLAHHLLNDGHTVVGIDGLKIEPLPARLSGVEVSGKRVPMCAIRDVAELNEALDDRIMAGFGGVAEYGITVRWDKNFLKLVRLLLERRGEFALFGGVRFGGTMSVDDAFAFGFDHIAVALGAGKPTVLDLPNGLARGVRTASDFLMALQLSGAAKQDSLANLQLRLPVVVIGGGLTAIDAATESLAYYPVQVEKFRQRYDALCADLGEAAVRSSWTGQEAEVAEEFLRHARALQAERARSALERRAPRIAELVQSWGGVTIAYRKRLLDSPSYTLNHEEVEKALEEGIRFAECLNPVAVEIDAHGAATALKLATQTRDADGKWTDGAIVELPAHTILMAAGTQPNTVLAREDADHFVLDGRYFRACDEDGTPVTPQFAMSKPQAVRVFLHKQHDGRMISFFGDLHPSYFGNVVKAMASAKQGYPSITRVLNTLPVARRDSDAAFLARANDQLRATVHEVNRLTPTILEIVVRAPLAARKFEPGQFYRLQNFETLAPIVTVDVAAGDTATSGPPSIREKTTRIRTRLAMEGLALTGAWVDRERGLISTIVLEMGGSSNLCARMQPGDPVILMGPTGAPTEIASEETVVLVGGGLGNAVLFSIGVALREAGCKVLYFAGYKRIVDRYKVEEIERAADVIVWCCDEAPGLEQRRPQDRSFVGNIVEAMQAYATGALGEQPLPFTDADRIIAIGSDRMMAAVAMARHTVLKPFLKEGHAAIGSINSPMQCMMKEICAQCLQRHVDPRTGNVRYVFSCFNQDQPLDAVDWVSLNHRLRQNIVQEKLTAQWIAYCGRMADTPPAAAIREGTYG